MFGNLIEVLVCAILKPFIYHLYKFFTLDISDGNDINFQNKGSIPPPTLFCLKILYNHFHCLNLFSSRLQTEKNAHIMFSGASFCSLISFLHLYIQFKKNIIFVVMIYYIFCINIYFII